MPAMLGVARPWLDPLVPWQAAQAFASILAWSGGAACEFMLSNKLTDKIYLSVFMMVMPDPQVVLSSEYSRNSYLTD